MNNELKCHDHPEDWVVEDGKEHINLTGINHSAVDLVEQVHQDKGVEDDSVHHKSACWSSSIVSWFLGDNVEAGFEEDERSEVHEEHHH